MNTESDLRAGQQGKSQPVPGQPAARPAETPAIQINMPKPGPGGDAPPRASAPSMDAVEDLLHKLMARLDENDRRYGDALEGLNQRLNDLSERAMSARAARASGSGVALDRVREQATSLAEQVNEAGLARQAQHGAPPHRLGGFAGANDDDPTPYFGDSRLNDDFADVTERLERSLAAHAPANDFDALAQRMDELGRHFDTALSRKNEAEALRSIETQLRALTASFGEARQNYARVEAIEDHLARLMNWAQSDAGAGRGGADAGRLDSIEQTLHALDRNARDMDARTVRTLEAMNEALHSIAASAAGPGSRNDDAPGEYAGEAMPPSQRTPDPRPAHEPDSDVWIESRPETTQFSPEEHAAALEDELGATIPDYQPAPGKPRRGSAASARRPAQPQTSAEPAFGHENDFIASARRAAASAAREPASEPRKPAGTLAKRLTGAAAAHSHDPRKPRRILYFVAAGLLLMSAVLLYARLKTQSAPQETGIPQQTAPQPPAILPKPPAQGEQSPKPPQPKPPVSSKEHSERMRETPAAPAATRRAAPLASEPDALIARTGQHTPPPAPVRAIIKSGEPISTATLLASLPPNVAHEPMPGVSVTIEEPSGKSPASRADSAARAAAPALVPASPASARPDPMPLPKRAPSASTQARQSPAGEVDSAPANEISPSGSAEPANGMPPARIGPNSLRVAAARGNPAAQVEIASRYAKGLGVPKDMKKAAEWYGRAAAQGYAPGQYRLAALYERGHGVTKDVGVASTWYRRAAELGNVRAMHNLAVLYTRGEGRSPDYGSARNWFYEAARHGLADSQFNLGILYESGLGVTKNIAEAYKWFSLAAMQGDAEAQKRREALRPRLPARSLSAAEQTIRRWRAAKPKDDANRSGPPPGGWQNAEIKPSAGAGDPALIAQAQKLLNRLGYDAGVPDGKLGPQTSAAIRRFQTRTGTAQTGTVSHQLLQRLEALAS